METPLLIAQLCVLQSASGVCPPFIGNHVELIDNYLVPIIATRSCPAYPPRRGGEKSEIHAIWEKAKHVSDLPRRSSSYRDYLTLFPRVRSIARGAQVK